MSGGASIDLNADVGEGCGFDEELIPLVTSVNIACGGHAGDASTMRGAVALALASGAAIGAHPGFEDPGAFGRREMPIGPGPAAGLVLSQVERLVREAAALGGRVGHVKLHGALYNMASRDPALAVAVAGALRGTGLVLYALAGSALASAGAAAGLSVVGEAFADRTYLADGSLAPRSEPGAVIEGEMEAARQALSVARDRFVIGRTGERVRVDAGSICIHGDRPGSPGFARRIRADLAGAGIAVRRPYV